MARTRRKSSTSRSGGSTLFGILIGLIFGLAAAVAVALFVTKVPMPFVDRASRDPAQILLPDPRDAPDPNLGLYGKNGAAGVAPTGPTDTRPAPLPSTGAPPAASRDQAPSDNLGDLIANLSRSSAPDTRPAAGSRAQVPGTETTPTPPPAPTRANETTSTTYFLQTGAFRSRDDAEAMQARILMIGLPVQIQTAQLNGETINRVRVGPFKGIDDMNRSRARLGSEKIDSTVVRQ